MIENTAIHFGLQSIVDHRNIFEDGVDTNLKDLIICTRIHPLRQLKVAISNGSRQVIILTSWVFTGIWMMSLNG